MNEKTPTDNRSQYNSRRSDVSPSLPRENANAQTASTDNMGKRDEPKRTLCAHVWRKEEKRKFIQNNRDPYYKEEIKIPPPHPHKRKNINFFPHSKYPYFLWERGRKNKGKMCNMEYQLWASVSHFIKTRDNEHKSNPLPFQNGHTHTHTRLR